MDYLVFIIVGIVGVVVGMYLARKTSSTVVEQTKPTDERTEKIVALLGENEKITNNDVEKLFGVSDATATRYLDELEKEGVLSQVGEGGRGVYYIVK